MNIISDATCGLNCWLAEEPICKCFCGGLNHGVMLKLNAKQPKRMAKLDGVMYELVGISAYTTHKDYAKMNIKADKINHLPENEYITHDNFYNVDRIKYLESSDKNAPMRVKKATKTQIANWDEIKNISKSIHVYLLWQKIGYITENNKAIVDAILNNDEIKYYTELQKMLINKHGDKGIVEYQERLKHDLESFDWYINFNKKNKYPEFEGIDKNTYDWILKQNEYTIKQ